MTEDVLEFENTIEDPEGRSHVARVLGREREDGKWVGWIRFTPTDGGAPVETDRETTQSKRDALRYWATGLTYHYLEGALERARRRAAEPGGAAAGARGTTGPSAAAATPSAAAATPSAAAGTGSPDLRGESASAAPPHRLVVESLDDTIGEKVMEVRAPAPGTRREIPDAGLIVYEGRTAAGEGTGHVFAVQFGSANAGATLANWLWSRLHGLGATVRVDGAPVEITNDALRRALVR